MAHTEITSDGDLVYLAEHTNYNFGKEEKGKTVIIAKSITEALRILVSSLGDDGSIDSICYIGATVLKRTAND